MDRILVGLDASPRSQGVLEAAVHLAKRAGGKLILYRGVGIPREIPVEAYSISPTSLAELLETDAKKYLDTMAATVPKELLLDVRVGVGTPWEAICHAADQADVDLIMIGSHGYSGIDRLIGTTAAKVVNHSKRSVLVVRAPERL